MLKAVWVSLLVTVSFFGGCRGGRGGIGAQPPWALGNSGDIFSSFTSLTGGNRKKKGVHSKQGSVVY